MIAILFKKKKKKTLAVVVLGHGKHRKSPESFVRDRVFSGVLCVYIYIRKYTRTKKKKIQTSAARQPGHIGRTAGRRRPRNCPGRRRTWPAGRRRAEVVKETKFPYYRDQRSVGRSVE